ncbi:MAG: gamma-glutamylcyclotransferase [bacterium]|nr:gamma-glutamylcyclotransferase [bacterium]MCP5068980.1 gamma-glutamylcyclotransferase [bacterium]
MKLLYFAYGSNLSVQRLQKRVATTLPIGAARLGGHRWVCDKPGRDGSAKANLVPDPADHVWGALYQLDPGQLAVLDRYEGGYERVEIHVDRPREGAGSTRWQALTYRSDQRGDDPVPFDWYRRMILDGARQHDLPAAWLARLESLPWRADPTQTGVR